MNSAKRFGMHDVWRALNERPERVWPEGVLHHGARLLLLVGIAAVIHLLFPVAPVPDLPTVERGAVAEEDVIARTGFPIEKSEPVLAAERAEAAAGVAPVFEYDPSAVDSMLSNVNGFLARVDSVATDERALVGEPALDDPDAERVDVRLRQLLEAYGFAVTQETIDALRSPAQRRMLAQSLREAIQRELPAGIVSTLDLEETVTSQARLRREGTERFVSRDSLRTAPEFFERAARHLASEASADLGELQRLILIRFFQPSVSFHRAATEAARERARQAVPTVKGQVLQGEKIIGAHEPIGEEEMERFRAYQEYLAQIGELDGGGSGTRAWGSFLFNALVLSIVGVLLFFFRRQLYTDSRHALLIAFLVLVLAGTATIIDRTGAPDELIPIALPVLVVAVLWDGRLALELALALAVLIGGQAQFLGLSVLFTLVLAGSVAALSVRVVRRRAQTWVFISIIALAYIAAALTLGLLRAHPALEMAESAGWGTLNAAVSALIAMGSLPLFEAFTNITTDQKLLELSDLDHPLLQRLRREAPGTFSHAINVANLAEAGAQAIDANPLLARVGVYYHDIGKIPKPQYFIENQPEGRNPHDKLKPSTSASIVREHVVEGLRLAEEYSLPDCIRDFIAEHHGTQPISFFYERARELEDGEELDPVDFAYPGPRPQSKETAIAMLADSVESAARVLPDPTPDHIRDLVRRIVDGKIELEQLAHTPLTMGEITAIEEQFTTVLSGMYHHRIDYPSPREGSEAEPATAVGRPAARPG